MYVAEVFNECGFTLCSARLARYAAFSDAHPLIPYHDF